MERSGAINRVLTLQFLEAFNSDQIITSPVSGEVLYPQSG